MNERKFILKKAELYIDRAEYWLDLYIEGKTSCRRIYVKHCIDLARHFVNLERKKKRKMEREKLKLTITFVDENNNVIVSKDSEATWIIDPLDARFDNKEMRSEITKIFTDQLQIDLSKGLVKSLVDEMFEKVIPCAKNVSEKPKD
jgi:hypothetical protein